MKALERLTLYQGKVFNVHRDRLEGDVYRDIVEHGGSVAIIVRTSSHLCLVEQYRHGAGKMLWEIPAGTLELDEDPLAAAAREMEEELGLAPDEMKLVYELYPSPGFLTEKLFIFDCMYWHEGTRDLDQDEDLEFQWFTLDEAAQMVYDGRIQDAKTIIAILTLSE